NWSGYEIRNISHLPSGILRAKKNSMKRLLFKIARNRFAAYFIGNAFAYLTPLMPLDKLYADDYAFI
ncbi:MAG: hypothetical protein KDE48_24615, partial [Anaerolineales bacterium]|nr:hypothetical protein [Anaerolineales bacterium]